MLAGVGVSEPGRPRLMASRLGNPSTYGVAGPGLPASDVDAVDGPAIERGYPFDGDDVKLTDESVFRLPYGVLEARFLPSVAREGDEDILCKLCRIRCRPFILAGPSTWTGVECSTGIPSTPGATAEVINISAMAVN
jgi:hypothetical protein